MRAPDPCPYCRVKVDLYPETRNLGVQVECANCGVRGPFKPTMEEAAEAFDRMRPPITAEALMDALGEAGAGLPTFLVAGVRVHFALITLETVRAALAALGVR